MQEYQDFGQALTPLQVQAIEALFTERTQQAAAERVGISPITLWRWSKQPAFRRALQSVIAARLERMVAKLAE